MSLKEFTPRILGFLCHWCCYAAADTAGVERYRRWRRTQAEIAETDGELMKLLDALAVALLAAYPPDDPIPPPRRRGRKPKKDGGGKR